MQAPPVHTTRLVAIIALIVPVAPVAAAQDPPITIGSKVFTESVILGDIATQLLSSQGVAAEHRRELGGTTVMWSAMLRGDIDCYPEYTGTLQTEIFAGTPLDSKAQLLNELATKNVWASPPLGFNNTYVLGMRKEVAQRLDISKMSDLAK